MALDCIENGQTSNANKYFEKSLSSANSFEAFIALQKIFETASPKQKLNWTKKLVKQNKIFDENVYVLFVRSLFENEKYSDAIKEADFLLQKADTISLKNKNLVEYYKACSILQENFARNQKSCIDDDFVENWLKNTPYNEYHDKFWSDFLPIHPLPQNEGVLFDLRHFVFERNYKKAFSALQTLQGENSLQDAISAFSYASLSDVGKAVLYGCSTDFATWAGNFEKAATESSEKQKQFYLYFYAARLYEKCASTFFAKAKSLYQKSFSCAFSDKTYDNALWYYLKISQKSSDENLVSEIEKYGSTFRYKFYYSDIFESLMINFLQNKKWNAFCALKKLFDEFASDDVKGKYYYLCARILEEKLATDKKFDAYDLQEMFFDVVQNKYSATYYVVLAASHLKLTVEATTKIALNNEKFVSPDNKKSKEITQFLDDCLKHKRIQELYRVYVLYKKYVDSADVARYAKKANEMCQTNDALYSYVIRLASCAMFSNGTGKDKELLQLYYPRFFYDEVNQFCALYELDEVLLYGLIYSESLFNKKAISRTGAVGLCQLMPLTAGDIARKLKLSSYDLSDASTNIRFGAFYLAELIRRLDGDITAAVISYNSGISRVRKWQKQYGNVPNDIFIEMLPIEESRGYGKKIFTAATIYGYLYYKKTTEDIIFTLKTNRYP